MRISIIFSILLLFVTSTLQAQELEILVRPGSLYVESITGNITPMERVFFHIILRNASGDPLLVNWVRFDLAGTDGNALSGQYSGSALTRLFDSAIDRRRIEPTQKETLTIGPNERKAISDVLVDYPAGFVGESLVVEVEYQAGGKTDTNSISTSLARTAGFAGRLPFDGVWYVAGEHGYLDPHKRFLAESFAYDFLQIGTNGRSYQREGMRNSDYYAYGEKVLASKEGVVVFVRSDIIENEPGIRNVNTPGGNVVVIDHGGNQFSYYGHLKPGSVSVRVGAQVQAGDSIAEVGNSGDSSEPHLHFHLMDNADPLQAQGIPATFANWQAQSYGRSPLPRESGLLPRGEFVQH